MTTTARFVVTVTLTWAIFICWVALAFAEPTRADARRPLPVPSTGGVCPSGYSNSPTSGMCTPSPSTRSQAVPQQGY
jgi:hypothetical protein